MIAILTVLALQAAGSATVECTALPDGRVGDCRVISETRPGLGASAIRIVTIDEPAATPGAKARRVPPGRFRRTVLFRDPAL